MFLVLVAGYLRSVSFFFFGPGKGSILSEWHYCVAFPTNPWQDPKNQPLNLDLSPLIRWFYSKLRLCTGIFRCKDGTLTWVITTRKPSKNLNQVESLSNSFQTKNVDCFQLQVCQLTSHSSCKHVSCSGFMVKTLLEGPLLAFEASSHRPPFQQPWRAWRLQCNEGMSGG